MAKSWNKGQLLRKLWERKLEMKSQKSLAKRTKLFKSQSDISKIKISALLMARNEEEKIKDCLESLKWVDEMILVDNESTDNTVRIAKKFGCKIFKYKGGTFPKWRNFAAKKATGNWFLFIDADERVNSALREEIIRLLNGSMVGTFAIPRKNTILGKEFKHSGQWPDYVIRLISRDSFIRWERDLHEQPIFKGELTYLNNPLIHIKHDNLHDMVSKTNKWSEIEAELMYKAHHPPMNIFRFLSAVSREFLLRFIKEKAFLDGTEGVLYGTYQIFSRFLSYAKLWEMQTMKKVEYVEKVEKVVLD